MGKRRLIAETGAGQHGVASATAAALFGLECTVYMGEVDTKRQELNVFRMELLGRRGATGDVGEPHAQGRRERGHARLGGHGRRHPLLPRVGDGPAPVPVHGARSSSGSWARRPTRSAAALLDGADPDVVVACVGGGSNAAGTFAGFVDTTARLVGVEAAGGAAITNGIPGILHGMHSRCCRTRPARSKRRSRSRPGWTTPGWGPSTPIWPPSAGPSTSTAHDDEVLEAFTPAEPDRRHHPGSGIGSRRGLGGPGGRHRGLPAGSTVLITLSGRGDKDVAQVQEISRPDRRA